MLKSNALDSLFLLLQEMTLAEQKNAGVQTPKWMSLLEKYSILGFMIILALMVLIAAVQSLRPAQILVTVGRGLYAAYVLFAMLFFLGVIFVAGQVLWRGRKQRFVWLLNFIPHDMRADAKYVSKLLAYDKPTLVYGLLQYRHRVELQDGRIGLFSGDLRKLGFFPTLAASVALASTLMKNDSNILLWGPLILAVCFSCMALYAQTQRERPQQVIDLLKFAIDHIEATKEAALAEIVPPSAARGDIS
jgi:hypothetical protein